MPQLYRLAANPAPLGSVELIRESGEELTHEEILRELSPPSGIWEHVNCRIDDKLVHLFCDDNGRAFELPVNVRGSVAYANNHLIKPFTLDQLLAPSSEFKIWHTDAQIMLRQGLIVVGDCLLWTGDLT
jgi:hypothetical protein